MKSLCKTAVAIASLALFATLTIPTADALDEAQAWDYIHARPREAVQDIVKLAAIENATPEIGEILWSIQIVGRDVHVIPAGPAEFAIGPLTGTIEIQPSVASDVIPPARPLLPWLTGAAFVGVVLGVVGSALLF